MCNNYLLNKTSLYHPVDIGSLHLDGNLFLAPMAGYTEKIYRSICLRHGASLAYTEMVSAEGVFRESKATMELMCRGVGEKNLAVQLFMPNEDTAMRCIDGVLSYKPDLIDINCGCPVLKVVKTGCGSALLKEPEKIASIVRVLVENCGPIPITVKIRTGWDKNSVNYLKVAESAFDAGASALCMHARTKTELYMPTANWNLLNDLKSHFPEKTIIGSGDLFTEEDGLKMLLQTGVDAVSFARGAVGNPFIFSDTKKLIELFEKETALSDVCFDDESLNNILSGLKGSYEKTKTTDVIKNSLIEHLDGLIVVMGENKACREMRKHASSYIKGRAGSSKVKNELSRASTRSEYVNALDLLTEQRN